MKDMKNMKNSFMRLMLFMVNGLVANQINPSSVPTFLNLSSANCSDSA